MSDIVKEILRAVSSSLQIPTIIILILLILLTILMLGSFVAEIFTERKSLKLNIPDLVDQLQNKTSTEMKEVIEKSGLLNRQKDATVELLNRTSYSDDTREALARQIIADEEIRYGRIVKITDLISRVAPMFGLMGTLIPLGPGLIALGQGDTNTLSSSFLIAFDTTVAGLISGAISYVVSGIRKNWYEEYMIGLETVMETILDVQSEEREKASGQIGGKKEAVGAKAPQAGQKAQAAQPGARPQQPQGKQPPRPGAVPPQGRPVQQGQPHPGAQPARPGAQQPGMQPARPAAPQQVQQPVRPAAPHPGAQPVHPAAPQQPGTAQQVQDLGGFMSRETQAAPVNPSYDSKVDQTMVQSTFQEEVRAAEEAMRRASQQAQGRQVLHRPDAGMGEEVRR